MKRERTTRDFGDWGMEQIPVETKGLRKSAEISMVSRERMSFLMGRETKPRTIDSTSEKQ